MDFLPLCFSVRGWRCLIVGGGGVALRKAQLLARGGAVVDVVAPRIDARLKSLVEQCGGSLQLREYREGDIQGQALVVAACDAAAVNQEVARQARQGAIAVNVVDAPELSSFVFPSIVERHPLVVAVSSAGQAPALVRFLRARLEAFLPLAYGPLARLSGNLRQRVRERYTDTKTRRVFWEEMLGGPLTELMLGGRNEEAHALLEKRLKEGAPPYTGGEVYLVGAGPGDPDLLTFRALRLMQRADVVVYDRLVSPEVLQLVPEEVLRIYAGKTSRGRASHQQDINTLLVEQARQGKRVLRLKGGDPFLFGRGGEEISLLADAGIPFQIVPGITAAVGCAAYAGIPLTHRDYAHSVQFLAGHSRSGALQLPWEELRDPHKTLVFYMSLENLEKICRGLRQQGRAPETPAALVQRGTCFDQKLIIGTLEDLPGRSAALEMLPPALLIVGEVVRLHSKLAWFPETKNGYKI